MRYMATGERWVYCDGKCRRRTLNCSVCFLYLRQLEIYLEINEDLIRQLPKWYLLIIGQLAAKERITPITDCRDVTNGTSSRSDEFGAALKRSVLSLRISAMRTWHNSIQSVFETMSKPNGNNKKRQDSPP